MRTIQLGAVVVLLFLSGCATLLRGERQKMKFDTEPEGATVTVNDGESTQTVTTPGTLKLKRKERQQVMIEKAGYRPVKFEMAATWDGASLPGLILPGGSLSVASDRASGADLNFYKLETIKLEPATGANPPVVELFQHRGKLYTKDEYAKVMEEEEQYRKDMSRN